MKRILRCILFLAAATLVGCASPRKGPDICAKVTQENGVILFTNAGIEMQRCAVGTWDKFGRNCEGGYSLYQTWHAAMSSAGGSDEAGHDDWRIPTRADMTAIGHCLKDKEFWVAELGESNSTAVTYDRGLYRTHVSVSHGPTGILIRGGQPREQAAFERLLAEEVKPILAAKDQADRARRAAEEARWKREADVRDAARKRAEDKFFASPKGTEYNCTSNLVVPANWLIDNTSFNCPVIGTITVPQLRANKWKVTGSQRTPAQATGYRETDFGQENWNGRGVTISIDVVKQ